MKVSSKDSLCPQCGAATKMGAKFCGSCGSPVPADPAANSGNVASMIPTAAKIVRGVSLGGMQGAVLPSWQVMVGEHLPVFPALPKIPSVMPRLGLKGPLWSLVATTVMDVGAAMLTQNPAALKTVMLRAGLAAITVVVGLVGGARPFTSKLIALSALVLALVQAGSIVGSLQALSDMSSLGTASPNLITQGFAITAAARLAWTAARQALR
ncbi:MAG: zinc ribbon domain-containing protein [Firmicutes bacterium]|nr:zinc ribbon domain-containing protein [Bacillota bacterium]